MQQPIVTIEEIESKEFHVAARGYDHHEVDEFLDSICDELERQAAEIQTLRQENERLRNQAVPHGNPVQMAAMPKVDEMGEGTCQEILELAKRVKDMTIADAQVKAAEIVANAQNEVTARLGHMDEEKQQLEAELAQTREAARLFKEKFAEAIAMAQEALGLTNDL